MDTDESKKEDYSEAMNDPAFLQVSIATLYFVALGSDPKGEKTA